MGTNFEIHPEAIEKVKKQKLPSQELTFGKVLSPIMLQGVYSSGKWQRFDLLPYQNINMDPCTKVLHYGQEIFEGLKAFKHRNGNAYLFRPQENARRFQASAERMSMPKLEEEDFIKACTLITAYSHHLIPARPGESLYLRPFMIASEVGLGIKPAKEFLFLVVASPSGAYFASNELKVFIERSACRAAPGGTGAAKAGGNYAASLKSATRTLELGCDQTMWLDAIESKYIEEMSGMNFFCVIDGELHTPAITDTILNGITRHSLLEIARSMGLKTIERRIPVNELLANIQEGRCSEAFVCGTASVVVPIHSFMDGDRPLIKLPKPDGDLSTSLKQRLIEIQQGKANPPNKDWLYEVEKIDF